MLYVLLVYSNHLLRVYAYIHIADISTNFATENQTYRL